jgi:hypothetical protein
MNEIILFDSNDAAHFQTGLSGWVSRHGHYWGIDERAARYDGCTHTRCEDCGEPVDRGRLICTQCHEKRQIKRYDAMPKEEWNGEGMLYSDAADRYFQDWYDVECFLEDEGGTANSLRLIICEPEYLPPIQDDYGCDVLAEDVELPDEVIEAIDKFNKIIKNAGAVSWYPGKKAVILK